MSKAKDIRDGMKTYMRMLMVRSKLESIYHEYREYVYVMTFTDRFGGPRIAFLYGPNTHNPITGCNNPITGCHNHYKFHGILELIRHVFHSRILLC